MVLSNFAAKRGGGIFVSAGAQDVRVVNCTIYRNRASPGGGLFIDGSAGVTVENCIVLNNDGSNVFIGPGADIPPFVAYSNAGNGWPEVDTTNVAGDPRFVDPFGRDFHLQAGSVCIDAGNPDPAFNDPDGSRNDMGAFGGPYGDW